MSNSRTEIGFQWDPAKAVSNERKHGVPFEFAVRVFDDPRAMEADTTRTEDRETRTKAVGSVDGLLYCIVFTRRDEFIRVISARRANSSERKLYDSV